MDCGDEGTEAAYIGSLNDPTESGVSEFSGLGLDRAGHVLLVGDTAARWTGEGWQLYDSSHYGFGSKNMASAFEDSRGGLWLGAYRNGNVLIEHAQVRPVADTASPLSKAVLIRPVKTKQEPVVSARRKGSFGLGHSEAQPRRQRNLLYHGEFRAPGRLFDGHYS